ncbi:electron transfer flavoprotein-ubiquinone oxidoreductase [Entomobacter blattae]|uniref:Electron transfer flavoprotein-ubiquinone oxidoreductase n=1 Tax=Entomobacter blattae TaxID=2762277 RepID=A0A7H1NPT0_9PROT|nr:electron transfer flavoprotein-ubiquinone oxidoreductase [Entomobacter blattae]QNT77790.1 Electron transfer flavoprotein-ubiquinone oxidoreductase [Entomobacter blattae]
MSTSARESMEFDVVIVGGGPSGLAAAIRLKQLRPQTSICLIEKGAEIGAHILSGAVIESRALEELFPDWSTLGAPLTTPVTQDNFYFLTRTMGIKIPLLGVVMPYLNNHGNFVVSLGDVCRWLAQQAEGLGVDIFPGFAGAHLLIEDGHVVGVGTGDMGVEKGGQQGPNFTPGIDLKATFTLFAEGCRGSLTRHVVETFKLREHSDPPTYGLGIKEVWEIPREQHKPGYVQHTVGWPLDSHTYGGSWLYHFGENLVSYGLVIGLDYANTWLSPFEEMQRLKNHPILRKHLQNGKRIAYGARALSEGGIQSLPTLAFPGGALVGDTAGFMNVPKIKGTHTAMKSGILAAESVAEALDGNLTDLSAYQEKIKNSWLWKELQTARNVRPSFSRFGNYGGMVYSGIDSLLFRGHAPWTFHHPHADNTTLKKASDSSKIAYPKPDNVITFDKLSSLYLANLSHDENQPVHLKVESEETWLKTNWDLYGSPESRYCPAAVYEAVDIQTAPKLRINAQNCVQCKTCDIKDPSQNIEWIPPEGGSGPNYPSGM